jgi:hypothetical protein
MPPTEAEYKKLQYELSVHQSQNELCLQQGFTATYKLDFLKKVKNSDQKVSL